MVDKGTKRGYRIKEGRTEMKERNHLRENE